MVVERPASEQPPRVAVNARHVQIPLPLWVCLLERDGHVGGQRLHRPVERVEKNLLVLQKPRALVVKAQLPEKVDRCVGKASEHMFCSLSCLESILILLRKVRACKSTHTVQIAESWLLFYQIFCILFFACLSTQRKRKL